MREKRTAQTSLFDPEFVDHQIGRELRAVSDWLDEHPELVTLIEHDIAPKGCAALGRQGMSIETVLRCAFLLQYRQASYRELAFLLADSRSFQHFARVDPLRLPTKSTLQSCLSRITAGSWEALNLALVRSAMSAGIDRGRRIRFDATATDSNILEPSDSRLLYDCVRVAVRLLGRARQLAGCKAVDFRDHTRVAKRRDQQIQRAKQAKQRTRLYRDQIRIVQRTLGYLDGAWPLVMRSPDIEASLAWIREAGHYRPLMARIVRQTERRVLEGETVPAREKIVSLFEEHTDIIRKNGRETQFGHKVTLSTGASGLVFDAVVEAGNPADSTRFVPMLERHIENYGKTPQQVAADGGYTSKANLEAGKALGIKDVVFHKKRGLEVEDMARSSWLYRKLKNFRAGIEAGISYLKRCFGLDRCRWKGLAHYKSYVWSAIFAHNLVVLGRLRTASG